MPGRMVRKAEFDAACDAVWQEIEYQNDLPRRTADEATCPGDFAFLADRYMRKMGDAWADNAGNEASLPFLRQLAAIWVRAMVYCGIRYRK